MSNLVILESDKGEVKDIDNRLKNDGFSTAIPVEHKLRYIWRQLTRSETSLKSSLDSVEQLRKQHAEEMIEVENYVSHIRQLSDEREALTQDLETENEQLKAEMEQMKVEREAGAVVSEEVCDMLMESGLTQIAKDTNTVKNQISFLLKERIGSQEKVQRLERENDLFKREVTSGQSNKKAMEIVDAERKEMEEEMNRMRQTTQQVKMEMSKMHKTEIENLSSEKNKLSLEIQKTQKQHTDDMTEMIKRFEGEKMRLEEEKEKTTDHLSKADRVMTEMEEVKLKMKAIEQEKISLYTTVKSLEDEIRKEKEQLNKNKTAQDTTGKKLKMELSMTKQKLQETEAKVKSLQEERGMLESRLQMANRDLNNIKEKETKLSTEKETLLTEGKSNVQKLKMKVSTLSGENISMKVRLKTADDTIERQIKQVENLTVQLAEAERMLRDKEEDMDDLEKSSKNEINSLKARLKKATEEASDLREELAETKGNFDKVVVETVEKLKAETWKSKDVEEDRVILRAQIADLRKDLEASLAASVSREKETMEQIGAQQGEKDNLARELVAYITREKDTIKKSEELSVEVQTLEAERSTLHTIVTSQEKQVADLIIRLEKSDHRCAEVEQRLHTEQSKSAELSTKFHFTSESSTTAKQEVDTLKDEVKALTSQLLRQHDASLDSRSKYEKLIMNMRGEMEREREKTSTERHSLASQLEQAMRENKELSALLRARDENLGAIRQELTSASTTGTKASTALEFESKIRGSLETRANHLESELTKAWEQTKDLTTKVSALEATKRHLEVELDRKSQHFRQSESTLHRRQAEHTALIVSKDTAQQQAEEAEVKLAALRREYEDLIGQLEQTEKDLKTASEQLMEMHLKNEENNTLRGHLEEEEVNKSIQQQTVQELERQVSLLQDRNNQLQKTAREHEDMMAHLKERINKTTDQQKQKEDETKSLAERMNEVFQENDMLRKELISAADRIDSLQRKNDERKTKTQAKMQALRDRFSREKRHLEDTVLALQSGLELSQERAFREEEWDGTTAATLKNLQQEKRDLLTKLMDAEEMMRDYQRQVRQSEAKLAMLDRENNELQSRVNNLLKDRNQLSRELGKNRSLVSSPFTSPQQSGAVDSQVLMNALARLHQPDNLERSSSSPDLYSPENRSPERTINLANSLHNNNNNRHAFMNSSRTPS